MAKKFAKTVEIFLLDDVPSLGNKGEIKKVRWGFFSNFLLPQKLAILASEKLKKEVEEKEKQKIESGEIKKEELAQFIKSLSKEIEFELKANIKGKLYKNLGSKDIMQKIEGQNYIKEIILPKKKIDQIGSHIVTLIFKNNKPKRIRVKITSEK